jgi:putative selenate reductase molybdopterin-binding subunit
METFSYIGKRVPKIDGIDLVMGSAKFVVDLGLPGMLCGKILRSPLPHARIRRIDTSKAQQLPGVKAVVTGADFPKEKYGYVLGYRAMIRDEAPLAWDKVRCIGDAVAAVAAIDEETAEEALDLITVDYEELPAIFDPEKAMEPEAPLIHEGMERNITAYRKREFGDLEKGFREADYVFEDRFETSKVTHCCLMPRTCLANYERDRLTVWATTQTPYRLRRIFSDIFDIPQSKIRVIQTHMGAGFGGRVEPFPLDFAAILLSQKAGRPVKIVHTREEEFTTTRTRHPWIITVKTGVKKNGKILAREVKAILDGGAYCSSGPNTASWAGYMFCSLYKVPNIRFEYYVVYTNKVAAGSFRGFGTPQVWFASESQLDMITDRLGLDPGEIRLQNLYEKGDVTTSGAHFKSIGLRECILKAMEESGWKNKRKQRKRFRGIGMACMNHASGARYHPLLDADFGTATIKLNEDGTANLAVGTHDLGQGSSTVLCQIVAEVLGMPLGNIQISSGDTEVCPEDMGTFASRQTVIGGNAVLLAAQDARRQLFEAASQLLGEKVKDLGIRDGEIFIKGSPDKSLDMGRVIRETLYRQGGHTIIGKGHYDANCELPDSGTGYGNIAVNYIFGCHVAEVEVDPNTGRVKVLKVVAAHDLGRAINPMGVEGQIEGSVAMGLGYALTEEMVLEKGKVFNPSFLDYRIPSAMDMADVISILVEAPDPEGPFGAKGVGEPGLSPLAPAIANAIYNAVGIRIKTLPMKPEEIFQVIKKIGVSSS